MRTRASGKDTARAPGKGALTGRGLSPAAASSRVAAASGSTTSSSPAANAPRMESGLEITPAAGEFTNFDVDTTYVMPFRVCNRSSEIQTLRFSVPTPPTTAFRLMNAESIRLAPGLSHVLEVEFMTHTIQDYRASFTILMDTGGSVTIPLAAVTLLELEYPSTIDFGSLEQHRAAGTTRPLRLVNRCTKDAVVSLVVSAAGPAATTPQPPPAPAPGGPLRVSPREAGLNSPLAAGVGGKPRGEGPTAMVIASPAVTVAQALGETVVVLELPRDVPCGHHQWTLTVAVDGIPARRTVLVTADVVDSRSRLLDTATGLETVSVSFAEKAYEGTSERYALTISNGSAQRVSFAFQLANDSAAREMPPFRLVPEQGHLGPREARQVTLIFEPPLHPVRTGWASRTQQQLARSQPARTRRYEALFSLLFVETEQSISFHVAGEACATVASLSESVLDFGTTTMNGIVTRELELSNGVGDLPLRYKIDRVASFHVSQPTGSAPPGGSVVLQVGFQPRRLGHFREQLTMEFNGGGLTRTVTLVGRSVAPARDGAAAPSSSATAAGDGSGRRPQGQQKPSRASSRMFATAPAALGATAVDVPQPVDIGMIPGQGLVPPRLPASAAELNRQMHADDAALRHHTQSGGHVAPVAFSDTKALIKRVYPETPANPIERRDCRRELMPMDLLKVSLPVKALDFERITVGATATRSLFVFNGTDGCMLVAMPSDEEPHLKFSPSAQVVPPSRMAHFEASFTGTVVQTVQQVIQLSLNTRYQLRVAVRAEVAPVEVTLSRSEVLLNFGSTADGYATAAASGDPVVQAEVVMTNSGSSPAPFRWTLPPQSSAAPYFSIQPARGVLAPMSTAAAEVIYAPPARDGTAEVTCEAILSVEGAVADRSLRLVGVVAPTKCMWGKIPSSTGLTTAEEATVDLRLMAAGKEVALTVPLMNKGRNDAFFSFEALPRDVTLTPATGRVGAGETEELLLSLCVPSPGVFNHTLVCNICGMRKALRLNLRGEVAAPPVIISAPALAQGELLLDFGEIYVGAERVRSLRLTNSGSVEAVIEVDLRPRSNHQQGDPFAAPPRPDYYCVPEGAVVDEEAGAPDGCVRAEVSGVYVPRRPANGPTGESGAGASAVSGEGGDTELVPGLYRLTLPPASDSLVRIAFAPRAAAGAGAHGAAHRERLYARWRQVGAEETHPLPSLVLQSTALPPKLLLRRRKGGAPSSSAARTPPTSAAAEAMDAGGMVRAVFPPVVVGRLPKPLHLELRNVSGAPTAWRLRRLPVGGPNESPFSPQPLGDAAVGPAEGSRGGVEQTPFTSAALNPFFLVEPVAGELQPGAAETLTVTFLANRVGSFTETYALVADEDMTKFCGWGSFSGTATEPQLRCEQGTIVFPTVPLGVQVRQTLYIVNDGFEAIEVSHDGGSEADSNASPVTVRFPQGNKMTFHAPRIPVEVVFRSHRPITLASSILLRADREGQAIEIGVRATAINSIVATEGFVRHYEYTISKAAEAGEGGAQKEGGGPPSRAVAASASSLHGWEPFKLHPPPCSSSSSLPAAQAAGAAVAAARSARRGESSSSANPYEAIDTINRTQWTCGLSSTTFVESLTSWLSGNLFARRPIPRGMLVEVLQSSYGSILCDAIELLFGRRPKRLAPPSRGAGARPRRSTITTTGAAAAADPKSAPGPEPSRGKATTAAAATAARAHKGLASLETLTSFMRYYGCCLSAVQLPCLLPYEEYLALRREGGQLTEAPAAAPAPAPSKHRVSMSSARRVSAAATTTPAPAPAPVAPAAILSPADFLVRATHGWMTVTLEVVRVFYLSRFAPDVLLKSIAPAHAAAFPVEQWASKSFAAMLSQSDVYSREEGCVLLWVQWAANQLCSTGSPLEHPRQTAAGPPLGELIFGSEATVLKEDRGSATLPVQLSCFDDLHDVRPLIAAVLMYVPNTRASFFSEDKKVIAEPALRSDYEQNADLLMQVLGELGIVSSSRGAAVPVAPSWLPNGKDWIDSDQTSVYLFSAFLMGFLTRFVTPSGGPAGVSSPPTPAVSVTVDGVSETETAAATTASVLFEGKLLAPITRTIQISNRAISGSWSGVRVYRAHLTNPAFGLGQQTVTVPANGHASFTLVYTPRHHRTDAGQCLLVDETPALLPEERTPLVLNLTVKPTDEPSRVFELETVLYEPLQTEIPVANPFTAQDCCVVSVRLSQEYDGTDPETGEAFPEASMGQRFSRAFFVTTDVLPLRRNEEAFLPVHCIPMARGTFLARLTFREDREGEFSFLLKLRCTAPKAGASGDAPPTGIEFRAELGESITQAVSLRPANAALERAVRLYEEKMRQQHSLSGRAPTVPPMEGNTYRVSFVNEQLMAPNPFLELVDSAAGSATTVTGSELTLPPDGAPGELRFLFRPKYVGEYVGFILLSSAIDMRLIPFRGKCVPKGEQGVLRFACPARQHITQNITLVNETGEDWLLSATFEDPAAPYPQAGAGPSRGGGAVGPFSGPQEVRVLAGRRKDYALKYSPAWMTAEEERGRLLLFNKTTGQRHVYDLVGMAEAPLSEDVVYVDCRAREARTIVLTVPNIVSDNCTYHMESSLPFTDGEPTVSIPRGSFIRYTLNIFPTVGGNYSGKVIFRTDPAGAAAPLQSEGRALSQLSQQRVKPGTERRYVWFLVHLSVTPPEKEGTVELDTDVRTPVVADVSITNPLAKSLTFTVRRYGAGLQGENTFSLAPSATGVYACTFYPSLIGQFSGRLSFFNDDVGEFWYEVKMSVTDSPAEELSFESPLGVPSSASVRIPNRSQQECQLMVHNSNTVNYSVSPPVIVVPSGGDALVEVRYTPSAVGVAQTALLTFSHAALGRWRYTCTGTGTQPIDSAPRVVACELGSVATVSLPLVSTLDVESAMTVTIKGETDAVRQCFSVQRAPSGPLPPNARATVVLAYRPRSVGHHNVTVEVRPAVAAQHARYDVCWRFPIEGCAEWRDTDSPPLRLRCAARKRIVDTLELRAPGLTVADRDGATITFEPDAPRAGPTAGAAGAASSSAIANSFKYSLVSPEGQAGAGEAQVATPMEKDQAFQVYVTFAPLRPVAVSGDLVLRGGGAGGGIWRYRVFLEAPPAPIDDTITISSALHTNTSVVFDLYNVFPYKSTFSAYFTPDSSKDLTASPAHGVLLPFVPGQRGGATAVATPIKVSFKPSLRVPQVEGTLVVDTEDMQWSFRVVGRLESQKRVAK